MAATETDSKELLTRRAQLVRLYEASASIEHPTDEDREFRRGLMNAITSEYSLKVRAQTVPRPGGR